MKLAKIKSIFKKEMLDLLRDKKTLIMMVLVPLVLYPLIMMVAMLVTSSIMTSMDEAEYKIAVNVVETTATDLSKVSADQADGVSDSYAALFDTKEFIALLEDTTDQYEYHLKVVDATDVEKMLSDEELDVAITVSCQEEKVEFTVRYLSSITNSSQASDMIEDKLQLYKQKLEAKRLELMGYDAEMLMHPIHIEWVDMSNKEERLGSVMGAILPFLLITSILMGAVYPAIDTTAGEKERGTLETLLTLPVKNDELILGKFFAVALVAVVSAVLNLLSMGIMAGFLFNMMGTADEEYATMNLAGFVPAVIVVLFCVVAFAMFISAVTMCVTTFAKSYKEANNYVTPLLLVVMFTGYIGFIPNITFTPLLAAIPVVNICLLINNLLVFKYNFYLIMIVLITNVAYAFLAVWVLGKIYNSEDIVFGEGGMSLQIFTSRKELKKGGVPNFSDAMLVACVSMLLLFYVGAIVQAKFLLAGLLMTQLMIIGVPALAAWYTKKDIKETFSLKVPAVKHVIGAILIEIGTYVVVMLISGVLQKLWPQDLEAVESSFELMLSGMKFLPTLLVIALAPAICEEALFRGYLFAATRKKYKPWVAILIVSALFGVYHMSIIKFFTTGLLGIAFAYVVYKTGSICCSSVMHFLNNGFSVVMMFYGAGLASKIPFLTGEVSLGQGVVAGVIAVIVAAIGVWLVNMKTKEKTIQN